MSDGGKDVRAGDTTVNGKPGGFANPDLCMLALSPQQIHQRLTERWANQLVPATLLAGINLSLAFGSEYTGLVSVGGINEVTRQVFLCASVAAFSLRLVLVTAYVQLISDLGRVPDTKMHEWLRQTRTTKVEASLTIPAALCTFVQVGIAFHAVSGVATVGTTKDAGIVAPCSVALAW